MNRAVAGVLGSLNPAPTPAEIADALWLAERFGMVTDPRGHPEPDSRAVSTRRPAPPPVVEPEFPYAASRAVVHALRALRRDQRSRSQITARRVRSAATLGSPDWAHLFEQSPVNSLLDLELVADDSGSMELWGGAVAQACSLLKRSGAFRRVYMRIIDSDASGSALLRGEPVTRTSRGIIVVLSDCVGAAWYDGSMNRLLERWSRSASVAILQMLPPRLWPRTGLRPTAVQWRLPTVGGQPNCKLSWIDREDPQTQPGTTAGVAIPVLQLEPRWLEPWAALVSGRGTGRANGVAHLTRLPAGSEIPRSDWAPTSPTERFQQFRATASPEAVGLAARYAAVPQLTLPAMRHVQRILAPETTSAHLAEVFLSGLLVRSTPTDRGLLPSADPSAAARVAEQTVYDFHPGVHDLLLAGMTRTEARRVLDVVMDRLYSGTRSEIHRPEARQATRSIVGDSIGIPAITIHQAISVNEIVIGPPVTIGRTIVVHPILPSVWGDVPEKNKEFVGRRSELAAIRAQLTAAGTSPSVCALHGLGGIGKTQVAVEYVYSHLGDYDLVWWVPAQQIAGARASLTDLWQRLGSGGNGNGALQLPGDGTDACQAVLSALAQGKPTQRWLLVFDNADQPQDVAELIPQGPGHVLVTSRNWKWADSVWAKYADAVEVCGLSQEDSVELLKETLGSDTALTDAEAAGFAEATAGLPIALVALANYLADSVLLSPRQILDEFNRVVIAVLKQRPPAKTYPASVAAVWLMGIERLRSERPEAIDVLGLCSFMGPEPIPRRILAAKPGGMLPKILDAVLRQPVALDQALMALRNFSFIDVDAGRKTFVVHRLLQIVVRDFLTEEQRTSLQHAAHTLLWQAYPDDPTVPEYQPLATELQPHVLAADLAACEDERAQDVVLKHVRFLAMKGDPQSAAELARRAVDRNYASDQVISELTRYLT